MRIKLKDDNDNYLRWGKLVEIWIRDKTIPPATWPSTVADLRRQLQDNNIDATVEGADDRPVSILKYQDDPAQALMLVLPTEKMLDAQLAKVGPGPYTRELMPSFVDIAYGGAARVNLSKQEADDFAIRRVGEYTINECC